jgi:DNA polymerase-3 subunit delta
MDYKLILKDIKAKKFEKIYFLHGEESYFIDAISNAIEANALEEHERDFNQSILYGKETDAPSLLSELNTYPMMAERRVVILKEEQYFKDLDDLEKYFEKPAETSIFVICYKHKAYDARKKSIKSVAKNGLVFKSDKVKEYQLVDWINSYLKSIGYEITSKASTLLAEFIGNDLSRIVNEIEKLTILIPKGTQINDIHIEQNIGVSKDYNVFELTNAIQSRDSLKSFKIIQYFENNPKATDITVVISNLFRLFSNIMRIHFLPNKSREAVAQALGVHPFVAGELLNARNNFDPRKLAANIETLHEFDLKAKGVGNQSISQGELMREMIFKLLH